MNYKLILILLLTLALSLPVMAAGLDGSFYNSAEIYYGKVRFTGGQGEYISELYNYSASSIRLRGLELEANLKTNSSFKVIFQVSNDGFESIDGSANFKITDGRRKYYMPESLKGSYARYIIKGEGHATITPTPLEHNKQIIKPVKIPKPLVMFMALMAGVLVMLGYDKVKARLKSNSKGLFLAIVVGLFFMLSSLGAATIEVDTADGTLTPETEITVTGQAANTEYELQGQTDASSWSTVETIATDGGGNARINQELDFIDYFINATTGNYTFRLKETATGDVVDTGGHAYGLMVTEYFKYYDHFKDGSLSGFFDYSCGSLSESSSLLNYNVPGNDCQLETPIKGADTNWEWTLNRSYFEYHGRSDAHVYFKVIETDGDSYTVWELPHDENWAANNDVKHRLFYNESTETYQLWNYDKLLGQSSTTLKEDYKFVLDVVPAVGGEFDFDWDWWSGKTVVSTEPIDPYVSDVGVTDWQTYDVDSDGTVTPEFTVNDNTYNFIDDVPDSDSLDLSFTGDGTLNYFKLYYEPANYLELVAPESGKTFETFDDIDGFKFNYKLPDHYKEGYISFKIDGTKIGGMGDYTTDLDGSCVVTESVNGALEAKLTDACINHTIEIDVPITGDPGVANWSVVYDADVLKEDGSLIDAEDANKTKTTIESNTRTFSLLQSSVNVYPYYPPDGAILTTAKPTFAFNVHSSIESTFNVYIDSNKQYSLDLEGREGYKGYEEFTPFNGLSEGSHTYYAEIVKDDGELLANTSVRSFDINLSIADSYGVDLLQPEDEATTRNKEQDFSYELNVTDPGFTHLYLNEDQIHGVSVDSQLSTQNATATLTPDAYFWYATFEPDDLNATITSDQRRLVMFSNVSVKAIKPEDDAEIIEPPITFKGELTTNVDGAISLLIDGETRDTKTITADYDDDVSFTVDADLGQGKHTWTLSYDSGNLDVPYSSVTHSFTLSKAAPEDGVFTGGDLGKSALVFKDLFGVDAAGALAFTALLISLAFTIAVGMLVNDGMVAGITLVGSLLAFSIMEWLPRWVILVLVIIAGYLLASKVAEG